MSVMTVESLFCLGAFHMSSAVWNIDDALESVLDSILSLLVFS